jgi:hypothetical protein
MVPADSPAQPGLDLQVGHQGFHKLHSWTPLQIQLDSGEEALEGTLEVAVPSGNVYRGDDHLVLYSRQVTLPPRSHEMFDFVVLIDDVSSPLEVSLSGRREKVISRSYDLRENLITGDFVVALGRSPAFHFLSSRLGAQGRVVHPRPEYLPAAPEGYDGVRALILHDAELSLLTGEQIKAMKDWAALGGRLIITGGPGEARYRVLADAALLPGRVRGIKALDRLPSLGVRYGESVSLPAPLPVVALEDVSGEVMLSEGKTPLIIRQRLGRGEVFFLTFDPTLPVFSRWPGFDALWEDLVPGGPPSEMSFEGSFVGGYDVLKRAEVTFPPQWQIALFALLYLVAYLIARRFFRGGRILWLVVSGITAVFILWAELSFYRPYLPQGYLNYQLVALDVYPDGAPAEKTTEMLVFSSVGRTMRARGRQAGPVVRAFAPESYRSGERSYRIESGPAGGVIINAPIRPWDARSFGMLEVVEPPVSIRISDGTGGAYVEIHNNTPYALTGGRLMLGGRMFKLKELSPHGNLRVDFSPETWGPGSLPFSMREAVNGPHGPLKKIILERYLRIEKKSEAGEAVFLAWLEGDPSSGFDLAREHRRVSLSMVRARFQIPDGWKRLYHEK